MKLQSVSFIGAITLSCALLSACGSKEEKTTPQAEVKPAVEETAPVQEAAPEPAQEEPALAPIQSLSEEKPAPAEPAAPVSSVEQESSGPFVIHSDQGIKAYVAEVENPGELEGTFYRVRVGYFSTIANAQQFGKEVLAPQGYAGWVDNRKNDRIGQPGASEDM